MRRREGGGKGVKIWAGCLLVVLLGLVGCGEEAAVGPTTQDFQKQRQALASQMNKDKAQRHAPSEKGSAAGDGFGAVGSDFSYRVEGRRDPFRSFEWEQMRRELLDQEERGPLEQFDLAQLSLVGVVWDVGSARALIQDPSGMSYVVGEGARVGKNEGRVTAIDDNRVVVRERYVDFSGKESTKNVEMHMRSSDGG